MVRKYEITAAHNQRPATKHLPTTACKQRRKKQKKLFHAFSALLLACCTIISVLHITSVNANADVPERYKYYTNVYVDRDTTLWDISGEYITEEYSDIRDYMDEVKSINHLPDDQLVYGTTICVPYYSDEYRK